MEVELFYTSQQKKILDILTEFLFQVLKSLKENWYFLIIHLYKYNPFQFRYPGDGLDNQQVLTMFPCESLTCKYAMLELGLEKMFCLDIA